MEGFHPSKPPFHEPRPAKRLPRAEHAGAHQCFHAALELFQELGYLAGVSWCLDSLGSAAALSEEPERAARLWGAAERLWQRIRCKPAPAARATYERAVTLARAQLGEEAFAAAWAEGQALTPDQAIAYAQG